MSENDSKRPQGKLVEIEGIRYLIIDGKLHRYADLTMDKGFKIVLGRYGSEEVLKHLLNRLLGLRISMLEYRNTEHPGMTEEDRTSRFDVYCEDENGKGFQVEMQNWSQKYFHKRAVYYSSLVLQDQAVKARMKHKIQSAGKKREWDYNYQPLYVVSFLNFKNWISESQVTKVNDYISTYRYTDVETKEELGDGTNLVFIDLYKFKKSIEDCKSLEDIWIYSIKNMFALNECPEIIRGTEIEELYVKSELANMTVEQRKKIEEGIMTQNDILNSIAEQIEDAREAAIAEGRKQGLEQGRKAARAEIIRQLVASGMTAESLASALGVDIKDIEMLNG